MVVQNLWLISPENKDSGRFRELTREMQNIRGSGASLPVGASSKAPVVAPGINAHRTCYVMSFGA